MVDEAVCGAWIETVELPTPTPSLPRRRRERERDYNDAYLLDIHVQTPTTQVERDRIEQLSQSVSQTATKLKPKARKLKKAETRSQRHA